MQGRTVVSALIAGAAMLVAPAATLAVPSVTGEFALDGATVGTDNELVQGPDGNMWVTAQNKTIVTVTPSGAATKHNPGGLAQDAFGIVVGPDGNLWASQDAGVVRITPAATPVATQFNYGVTGGRGITVGPDNNIWFAATGKLIMVPIAGDPNNEVQHNVPAIVTPKGMATGSDGALWIADGGGKLFSTTTAAPTAVTQYTPGGGLQDVAAGLNGQVAFANPGSSPHSVGLATFGVAPAQVIPITTSDPFGVAFGQDGAYWVARSSTDDLLRLAPDGTTTTLPGFSNAPNVGPRKIATGPNNTLWVTLDEQEKIARVSGVDPPTTDPTGPTRSHGPDRPDRSHGHPARDHARQGPRQEGRDRQAEGQGEVRVQLGHGGRDVRVLAHQEGQGGRPGALHLPGQVQGQAGPLPVRGRRHRRGA